MHNVMFDNDLDRLVELEEMGIGVGEIIQYARAVFSRAEIKSLIDGLESPFVGASEAGES